MNMNLELEFIRGWCHCTMEEFLCPTAFRLWGKLVLLDMNFELNFTRRLRNSHTQGVFMSDCVLLIDHTSNITSVREVPVENDK